jgi:uncharacterized protein YbbC (DUF1343 family)
MLQRLEALRLAGVRFERAEFTPRSIPRVATHPRFEGTALDGVRIVVTDAARFEPLEAGIHVLAELAAEARSQGKAPLIANLAMFHAIAGTKRLRRMLAEGRNGRAIIAAWQAEVARFRARRAPYLLY